MIIQLGANTIDSEIKVIKSTLEGLGYKATDVKTQAGQYIVAIGAKDFDIRLVGHLPGVRDIHRVSDPYKLVSSKWKVSPTVIDLGDGVKIGGGGVTVMAGPCSIESPEQVETVVKFLASRNVRIMRGGAFKPRTSPYSFRGLGLEGLKMFAQHARAHGIKVISEVLEISQIGPMYDFVDVYQVGARNNQNFSLLHELGRIDKPVLIKRGVSGTIEELLQAAEYVFSNGNERLILCERGIRTFEKGYRNTFDINAIPILKEKSHLPVIADPSHGIGIRKFVTPIANAAVAAGADGLLIEVHPCPEEAASDGQQTLSFDEASKLLDSIAI